MSSNETSRGLRCIFKQSLNFLALGVCLGGFTGALWAEDAQDVKSPPSTSIDSVEPKTEYIKEILEKSSLARADLKSFSAEQVSPKESKYQKNIKNIHFERHKPDGTLETRDETFLNEGAKNNLSISIVNNEGSWCLMGKTAIKMVFQDEMIEKSEEKVFSSPISGKEKPSFYKMSESVWDGKDCYVVTQTLPSSGPQDLIYRIVRFIGKEELFLYKRIYYDRKGEVINGTIYKNVKLNIPLEDNLFAIPTDLKKIYVKSQEEYLNILQTLE